LKKLLRAARARRDRDVSARPGEKPMFAEGDLFSSLFEGSGGFEVMPDSSTGSVHRIAVKFSAGTEAASWIDHAIVQQEARRWVITDIEYGGQWAFANKGTLRGSLREALRAPSAALPTRDDSDGVASRMDIRDGWPDRAELSRRSSRCGRSLRGLRMTSQPFTPLAPVHI